MTQTAYRADFHIHSLLSPCGDLEMSPANIVAEAIRKELKVIGITDHNSTRQSQLVKQLGDEQGLLVLCGAEVTTKEEVHCLTFFPDNNSLHEFQKYLDIHLPNIKNDPDQFGFQVCVDINEQIIFEEDRLLLSALDQSIEQVAKKVYDLNGIFIPAHINRPRFSIISQLGFVPCDLPVDALELSKHTSIDAFKKNNAYLSNYNFIQNSDAHYLKDIGTVFNMLTITNFSFDGIKEALLKNRIQP